VNAVQHLYRLGGVASRRQLLAVAGRGEVDQALRSGAILRDARGRYAVPVADVGVRAAGALSGVASHRTATARWGWAQKQPDSQPEVTVPRKRKVPTDRRTGVVGHWAELSVDDVDGPCTSPRRTMDLVDRQRRLVLEADSYAWHGSRRALRQDCRRYNRLVLLGYTVLRFTWEDVMHDPGYVLLTLKALVDAQAQPGHRTLSRALTAGCSCRPT